MQEIKTFKTADLVLKVKKSYDPIKLDLSSWERFIDVLCGDRTYQKEAIRTSIIFMASGKYESIKDLVRENWQDSTNFEIRERFRSEEDYLRHLQLSEILSANIDLATGTGKSYVIYGIAQIMLGIGLVDRVLVLCPSLTIESGLMKKFLQLSGDSRLINTIPENAFHKNPRVISANDTIRPGDVCVENIHAVYEGSGSSIIASLEDDEQETLVLNDEAHHIYNATGGRDKESQNIKKWKEFLLNPKFNFKYILGFTGTAYTKDDYFLDVIYRYSLRQAVDDKMVKMVDYVSKDDSINEIEKFQKIYENHQWNQNNYPKIKPITIFVTKDIAKCNQLASRIADFLEERIGRSREDIERKILIVTSHSDHKANVVHLDYVDDKENPVEWIVSVSMLTEGWDVKNVFQIVPWEDRAFNSKLLISQVLGRGLRVPEEYQSPQPRVRVFNHDAWSRKIRGLVDEILEIEMKLTSSVLLEGERSTNYNFNVYNINYDKQPIEKESKREHKIFDYTKGYIELIAQAEEAEKETDYTNLAGIVTSNKTLIQYNTYSVSEVVNKIYEEFKTREWEGKVLKLPEGDYTKANLPPKDQLRQIILTSMIRRGIKGDKLVDKNAQRIFSSFNTLLRKKGKTIVHQRKINKPFLVATTEMNRETTAVGNLRHNSTVFYTDEYEAELSEEIKEVLTAVIEDESLPRSAVKRINPYLFKTPMDIVLTKAEPERRFLETLCKKENAEKITAWVKSRDVGFYPIEYSVTTSGGKHSKQLAFNPDFFIKYVENALSYIIVVEIKSDNDDSIENKAKLKYARKHFKDLNIELSKEDIAQNYIFHFLSPNNYTEFFHYLRDGRLIKEQFSSELESKLVGEENED